MAELLGSITKPNIQATGILDLAGMLLVKRIVDVAAVPVVGNNNIVSGIAKAAIGGYAYHASGNRLVKVLGGGVMLDGFDDFVSVAVNKVWGGNLPGSGTGQQAAVNPGL